MMDSGFFNVAYIGSLRWRNFGILNMFDALCALVSLCDVLI